VVATSVVATAVVTGPASASPSGTCPAVHDATDCGVLVTIAPNGSVSITSPAGSGNPYDGNDDTIVGVVNESPATVASITLTSPKDVFAFDGDGICQFAFAADDYCTSLPAAATGYEGPDTTFSAVTADQKQGEVDFTGGLAPGASSYFGLENDLAGCADCVSIPTAALTVDKVDDSGHALAGAAFTVYSAAGRGGSAFPCDARATGSCTVSGLAPGQYWIDETTTPAGYETAAERTILVLGRDATVTVADQPAPAVAPSPSPGLGTTTTTSPSAPPAAVQAPPSAPLSGATVVHTGAPFAGSMPYALAVAGAGAALLCAGVARRRVARRQGLCRSGS
jgi:hypothetical protein